MKKNLLFIFCLSLFMSKSFCQISESFIITFENDDWKNYITFDTTGDTNIWTVGKPKGIVFNKAWEGNNAIFTDRSKSFNIPNKSSFKVTIPLDTVNSPKSAYEGIIGFYFKSNTLTADSFTIIARDIYELDLTSGWIMAENWRFKKTTNNDSVKIKFPPFIDSNSNWMLAEFNFNYYYPGRIKNTFQLEFVIISNSKDSSFEGLIIDSFYSNLSVTGIDDNSVLTPN